MKEFFKKIGGLTTFRIIILGFVAMILIGALLLMLPFASADGRPARFSDALFTSTSAVCVTGLVVRDTGSGWSYFGQAIILLLIQIGGLGVVTVTASFALLSGRKISLMQRSTMQEAIAAPKVSGVLKLTGFIVKITAAIELAGAIAMMPVFCRDFGLRGIWMSVFHSVSAFCNAGFDIMGAPGAQFVSLTPYAHQPLIITVVMLLIVMGGIGFITWDDIVTHGFRVKRYRMQSKVILVTSAVLVLAPAACYFVFDFAGRPAGHRLAEALFQSVTARTAGFNTVDFMSMRGSGRAIMTVLMLIGGSPGSTAGGMKTTTVAVLLANAAATFLRRESPRFFGRRIEDSVVKNAATILIMYVTLFITSALAISAIEGLPLELCLFETASAVGTVGLTLGITPSLRLASRCILMALMFFGRVGGLTLIYAAVSGAKREVAKLPVEKITVG